MAWHGDPSLLRRDGYSGDYGVGLYGYWRSAAAYVDCVSPRGWECMLCDIISTEPLATSGRGAYTPCSGRVVIAPREAFRRRAYVAPIGLTLSVEGAQLVHLAYDGKREAVSLTLGRQEAAASVEATLFLVVERVYPPAGRGGWSVACPGKPACARKWLRDGYRVQLSADASRTTEVTLERLRT